MTPGFLRTDFQRGGGGGGEEGGAVEEGFCALGDERYVGRVEGRWEDVDFKAFGWRMGSHGRGWVERIASQARLMVDVVVVVAGRGWC